MGRLLRKASCGLVLFSFCTIVSPVMASIIEIQFTGLDLSYDGSTISDAAAGSSDPLTTVTIAESGSPIAGSPFVADISIDLSIPGVTDIAIGGDTVVSATGGTLDLSLPSGDFLSLDLDEVTITYLDLGFVSFAFGGSIAGIDSQMLPAGLVLGDPTTISFSTTIGSQTDDGTNLLTFSATGTGGIEGLAIPEPATITLLGLMAVLSTACRGRRLSR